MADIITGSDILHASESLVISAIIKGRTRANVQEGKLALFRCLKIITVG